MAVHGSTESMLKESLREYLHVAEFCIKFRKDDTWGSNQLGGCLGYPGAATMFCVVDAIGSYHRQLRSFKVLLDGSEREIVNDSFHHFFILNSDYYGQQLSEHVIRKLYENYRNLLLHNAALAIDHILFLGEPDGPAFPVQNGKPHVNVSAFLRITQRAAGKFLSHTETIVPRSRQDKINRLKK